VTLEPLLKEPARGALAQPDPAEDQERLSELPRVVDLKTLLDAGAH
jgi:hypothetical protein